jgi:Uma2 family endonuclease
MSTSAGKIWTYDDYAALPDDGKRYEVIEGELYEMTSPTMRHQDIALWLAMLLRQHVQIRGAGRVFISPLDVVLSATNVVQPDVLFVADADVHRLTAPNIQGAPTLAVEVLSDARHDRVRKRRLYEQFDVKEYWIVDPHTEQVEVCWPVERVLRAGDTLTTDLLPGLEIDVATLLSGGL